MSIETLKPTKTVIFEGAGWSGAEHNGVGNCRIRGVFTTTSGRNIYLEMGGHRNTGHLPNPLRHLDFPGRVDHCFDLKDKASNRTPRLRQHERTWSREYTKANILQLLKTLDVEADDFEVLNENYSVFEDERYVSAKGD